MRRFCGSSTCLWALDWPTAGSYCRSRRCSSLALAAVDAVYFGLFIYLWFKLPQLLFLLVVLGYGSMLSLHVPIQEYVLRKYTGQAFSTHVQEDEWSVKDHHDSE